MDKKDLKIVFFGTPDFAVESLRALVDNGFNVVSVVTMPDKPAGRGQKLSQSAVKQYACEAGLPVMQPEKLKDPTFIDELRGYNADLFIVIAFRMLPEVVWAMPPLGTFNLHASLLPRYRGAAPINRAVMNGDSETGVTTFFLKHEIDTGDIIDREKIAIDPDEDAGSVHDRLMALGAQLTIKTVQGIIDGTVTSTPQSDLTAGIEPTPAPKIFKEDCRIDWTKDALSVHNHIRGLAPYPAAWTAFAHDDVSIPTMKVLKSALVSAPLPFILSPGVAVLHNKKVYAGTGSVPLELITVQPAGKKAMSAPDFLRGLRLPHDRISFC